MQSLQKPTRARKPDLSLWSNADLNKLIKMRACGYTFPECGVRLKRSHRACASAIQTHDLYSFINKLRDKLIEDFLTNNYTFYEECP